MQLSRPKRTFRLVWIAIVALIIGSVAVATYLILTQVARPVADDAAEDSTVATSEPVRLLSIQSKMLFTGNSFWGRYVDDWARKQSDRYAAPFSRLDEFGRDKYDAWITGLECPTTQKGTSMTSAQMQATLTFNCDPAYLPEFAKWFDIVTLANNHTDNQGIDGFTETQKALGANGIQYFGHYDPEAFDDICDVVSLPVKATWSDDSMTAESLPVAMCGYHGVFRTPSVESLALIERYAEYMPVISMPHSGAEYQPAPDDIKTKFFHRMIDNGADMVIGDHPHWVQTTEAYKDRLIVYSMGNFLFDQQVDPETVRSAAIQVTLSSDSDGVMLAKWLELGKSCAMNGDNCLAIAEQQGLKKIDATYTFGVVATDNTGYATHPATAVVQASVEERLEWNNTIKELVN